MKNIRKAAAVIAAAAVISCMSTVSFADTQSDITALESLIPFDTDLNALPVYKTVYVPVKAENRTEFTSDFVFCFVIDGEFWHFTHEEYEDNVPGTAKLVGIWTYEDGTHPGTLYRISDDTILAADHGCKYDKNGALTAVWKTSYIVCSKLPSSELYKNCWYTAEPGGEKYYIGKDHLPVTKSTTIGGVRYAFDKNGICRGRYTGWTKNSKGRMYYKNGVKVTKSTTVGGTRYVFSKSGICTGKYTGFTKNSHGIRYWDKGVPAVSKWFWDSTGNKYYAGADGYLYTGWHEDPVHPGVYEFFDENGICDGKEYTAMSFDAEDEIVLAGEDE